MEHSLAAEQLAQVVIRGLAAGQPVELDGLGVFRPGAAGFTFEARPPRLFLAYAKEDAEIVAQLYSDLTSAGFAVWMDSRNLIAGQNWPRAIEAAIESSGFFVACFSSHSARKRGGFQAEIRYALHCARQVPLDDIFIVPVRLDQCPVPDAIRREWQYIDLFPDWRRGVRRLVAALRKESARRLKRQTEISRDEDHPHIPSP
jgi:hypothetical protein